MFDIDGSGWIKVKSGVKVGLVPARYFLDIYSASQSQDSL